MEYTNKSSLKSSIRELIRVTAAVAFGALQDKYKQPKFIENSAESSLYLELIKKIDDGKIEEVENIIWERVTHKKSSDFHLALDLYGYMNEKDDDFLRKNHFSREEIKDGLEYVIMSYQYGGFVNI